MYGNLNLDLRITISFVVFPFEYMKIFYLFIYYYIYFFFNLAIQNIIIYILYGLFLIFGLSFLSKIKVMAF